MNYIRAACEWFEYRSRWSNLAKIGRSPFARIAILVPVFGYLILLNGEILRLADIDPRFKLVASENPWRIVMLYYGTLLAGIASGIFAWQCPNLMQRYKSTAEFVSFEHNFYQDPAHRGYIIDELRKYDKDLQSWKRGGYELGLLSSTIYHQRTTGIIDTDPMLALFWHCRDYDKTVWRCIIRMIFDVSLVVLSIPAAASLLGVIKYTFSHYMTV